MPVALSGGVGIHWEQQGDGEPLICIMGVGGSGDGWWRLLRRLPPGVRAITLDNRGTGASGPAEVGLTLAEMVADVLCVIDAAGLARAHVLGSSLGGIVAQHLALEHRERVASLLLASTTAEARNSPPPWRLLGAGAAWAWLGAERSAELLASALYAPVTVRERPELITEDLARRANEPQRPRTVVAQLLAVAGHDTRERLKELAGLGVTILHGAQDAIVAPRRARELAAAIPGAELVMIDACGHTLTTDAEAASAAAVLAHLQRHGERPASRAA